MSGPSGLIHGGVGSVFERVARITDLDISGLTNSTPSKRCDIVVSAAGPEASRRAIDVS